MASWELLSYSGVFVGGMTDWTGLDWEELMIWSLEKVSDR